MDEQAPGCRRMGPVSTGKLHGWQPFANWGLAPNTDSLSFIPDEKPRLSHPDDRSGRLTLTQGIERMRSVLRKGGGVVRLAGLSGVGKTRLARALFEESVLPDALPAQAVVYFQMDPSRFHSRSSGSSPQRAAERSSLSTTASERFTTSLRSFVPRPHTSAY